MAPTPPRSTPSRFEQTWNESDAAFLDPKSLPIAKIPHAWERKQETKVGGNGKQKKVWRRYTTRSRAATTQTSDGNEDDDDDSRFRAVKKLQRISPKAMETSVVLRQERTRAFRATRWDRRRSTLPRKKTALRASSVTDSEDATDPNEESQYTMKSSAEEDGHSEVHILGPEEESSVILSPDRRDRKGTFTFSVKDDGNAEASTDQLPPASPEPCSDQNPTLVQLVRSSSTCESSVNRRESLRALHYPDLSDATTFENEIASKFTEAQGDAMDTCYPTGVEDTQFEHHHYVEETKVDSRASPEGPATDGQGTQHFREASKLAHTMNASEVLYPTLPVTEPPAAFKEPAGHVPTDGIVQTQELLPQSQSMEHTDEEHGAESDAQKQPTEEEFTEASLQLDIQREMEEEEEGLPDARSVEEENESIAIATILKDVAPEQADKVDCQGPEEAESHATTELGNTAAQDMGVDDIAAGLILGPTLSSSRVPTARKLRSPSPPPSEPGPEETTMTIALDDDTALLKDFLSRAAASKASKAASIARRESLQNRRDSDVVRHALASPRKALEDKDPNSPTKHENEITLDLSQTLTLDPSRPFPSSPTQGQADTEDVKAQHNSRRSSRTRKSRLPAPSTLAPASGPPKIAVRRADGGEPIVLKKTDAQELSLLTRANTRKNKQGALAVSARLLKLASEAASRSTDDSTIDADQVIVPGKKYVRWDEQLAYYQEGADTMANMLAEAESLATPDELSLPAPVSAPCTKPKTKSSRDKNSTPKIRRVRGLGTANGTPGKGLLAPASLLPDGVQEEKTATQAALHPQRLPKPKVAKLKKMPVASSSATEPAPSSALADPRLAVLDIAPVGVEPSKEAAKERRSRLATPRKVKLPLPTTGVPLEGKENQQGVVLGLASSPAKKRIPMPAVIVPSGLSAETGTGLPRRRGRKL